MSFIRTLTSILLVAVTIPQHQASALDPLPSTDDVVFAAAVHGNTLYPGGAFTRIGVGTGGMAYVEETTGIVDQNFPRPIGAVSAAVPDGVGGVHIGRSCVLNKHRRQRSVCRRGISKYSDKRP
jgi:hypothetical protein